LNASGEGKGGIALRWFDKNGQSFLSKAIIYALLGFFVLTVLYPIYYLLMYSLSTYGGIANSRDPFMLLPAGFTWKAYELLFSQHYIHTGFAVTIFRTVVGSLLSVAVTALAAFALSKKELPGRKLITWFFLVNLFFVGGLIPTYLTVKAVGLIDSIWVLVLLPLFNTYYIMLLRSFFMGIPESLEEAARIDGAGEIRTFTAIILPIAVPSLLTIGTWVFFTHWNTWFDSMIYIQTTSKHVVQIHIRKLVIEQSNMLMSGSYIVGGKAGQPTEDSMRSAGIMITIIPVLIVYPFVKNFFSKGMVLGAVKE